MATTANFYGLAHKHFATAGINWSSDTIKMALCTSAYVPNQDTDEFFSDISHELAASGGYSAGGATLASATVTYNTGTNQLILDAADTTISSLTPSAAFSIIVIYKSTGTGSTSPLIAWVNAGVNLDSTGHNFTMVWAATGIGYITVA